ncbi:oxidoreductase-like protein [Massariosphaeria phaeospora]|uniref:Oxidoreductase-like protein n=1 Tax=Massariosphaeria phaeospora TaxID=100035 RepID=A0A7C8IFV9_9PLEO|nr:oxidoreductase-like protein [Massariosphaeria phaeospora]
MAPSNKAAWITEKSAHPFQVKDAELPKAGQNEVVIKNHAVAVNPVDWMMLQKYPNVLGEDVAGEVYEVGDGVTHVKKGDRVMSHCFGLSSGDPQDAGFQLYTRCNALVVSKIPSSMAYTTAAVLPLSISTAAECLFKKEALALPLPTSATNPKDTGKSVLVWGGSSSIGASAIQLAVGAGLKVVSVASAHNLQNLKNLGAAAALDYKSSSVVDDVVDALSGTEFAGVCDCIGTPDAIAAWAPVYKKLGGRYGSVMPQAQGIPEGMEGTSVFATLVATADRFVGEAVWGKWVPEALEKGTLKAKPDPMVIEGGWRRYRRVLIS